MDSSNNIVCPVCTLYLRPGITLKNHLTSHPKQKVIEALVRLSECEDQLPKIDNVPSSTQQHSNQGSSLNSAIVNQTWNNNQGGSTVTVNIPPQPPPTLQGNHVFIYQQSLSSTTTPSQSNVMNINPLTSQQYVVPTIFNSQMMPYVYQQQQVIMSSGSCLSPSLRTLPFELPVTPSTSQSSADNIENTSSNEDEQESQENEVSKKSASQTDDDEPELVEITEIEETTIIEDDEIVKVDTELLVDDNKFKTDDNELKLYEEQDGDCLGSPHSDRSDWSLRVRSDLNKACQTSQNLTTSPTEVVIVEEGELRDDEEEEQDEPEYFFVNTTNSNKNSIIYSATTTINYEETPTPPPPSTPIYSTLQSNDHLVDFIEMDGMQVPINEFSTNQIISQVENFDNNHRPGGGVLMTIGSIIDNNSKDEEAFNHHQDHDENISRSSSITTNIVNMRSDERMPARGELSGQESIGGVSDITSWNRVQYNEASSVMSTSYELLVRENWEHSDNSCSDTELSTNRVVAINDNEITPTIVSYHPSTNDDNDDDIPTIVGYNPPPLNFKCSTCGEGFKCLKDRKEHEQKKHNIVGNNKKKVKKLIVKLKPNNNNNNNNKVIKTENNFDNVFTNKLKLETTNNELIQEQQDPLIDNDVKLDNDDNMELKTICSICDCGLVNAKALKQHKLQVHKIATNIRHKCTTCDETFPNEYKFTEHLRIHPLECKLCGKLFYRKQNLQMHMKRHLGIKPYKCDVCEKSFLTRQKYNEHKNTHTGEAPIKCNLCNESFRRHSNLVQHRNRRHFNVKKKIKDYICFCQQVFHSKKKLAWHKEIHDSKPKSCTHCSEKFIHMSSLTRHMRRAHNERFLPNGHKNTENVECPICKGVYLKSSLEVHIRTHSGHRPFTCLICNKDFTTKWNLKLHKWTHASRVSKPFKCEHCKGAFIRESDYIAHMNSHKSIRPYTCNYCGAQFIRKYNCQRHVKEHENEKTFTCKVCSKSFHRSYYLKDHMRIHSGVRPFACHICGKTSATKSNHNKHMQIHHAREPVSTEN